MCHCWPRRVYSSARSWPGGASFRLHFLQRRAFMHGDVVGLVALDFILRIILARVVQMPLEINIFCMHLGDLAADLPGFRVPGHMITDLEFLRHDGSPPIAVSPRRPGGSRGGAEANPFGPAALELGWRVCRHSRPSHGSGPPPSRAHPGVTSGDTRSDHRARVSASRARITSEIYMSGDLCGRT